MLKFLIISYFGSAQAQRTWSKVLIIAHVALYIRVMWTNRSCLSLKKEQWEWLACDLLKKLIFFVCFWQFFGLFPPFLCLSVNRSCHSLPDLLFFNDGLEGFAPVTLSKRATVRDLLRWLVTKERRGKFFQVAHDKRVMGAICSFSKANCSFPHKKQATRLKNQWANSQPWQKPFILKKLKLICLIFFFSSQNGHNSFLSIQ